MANIIEPAEYLLTPSDADDLAHASLTELTPSRTTEPTDAALNISLVLAAVITTVCILCLLFAGFQLHHTNDLPMKTTLKDSSMAPAALRR